MKPSSWDKQLGLASPRERAASQSDQTNNPSKNEVRNEVGLDVSHHTRISQRGGEKCFFLDILFHRMSSIKRDAKKKLRLDRRGDSFSRSRLSPSRVGLRSVEEVGNQAVGIIRELAVVDALALFEYQETGEAGDGVLLRERAVRVEKDGYSE